MSDVFALDASAAAWVEKTLAQMSTELKAGQIINIVCGWFDDAVGRKQLDLFERYQPGSGIGGGRLWRDARAKIAGINQRLRIPLVVNADFEMGTNFDDATPFPSAMGMSAIADLDRAAELVYAAGATAAAQGRAVGVQWALAPVCDINANFRNPITNVRSFGDDPERVKRLSAAYIRGLQENGMSATAKHFPGDGYSDLDQHKLTTINPLSRQDWFRLSGAMFKNAIDAGVWTIMPGHIACPALSGARNDRGRPVPATLDPFLLNDILRGELGFTGLIVSDAFDMGGILEHEKTVTDAAVRGLAAGLDCLLLIRDLPGLVEAICRAVEDGRVSAERLDDACRRMLSLKARIFAGQLTDQQTPGHAGPRDQAARITPDEEACKLSPENIVPDDAAAEKVFDPPLNADAARAAGEGSVTLTHDIEGVLPLKAGKLNRVLINILNEEQFWGADGIKLFGNTIPELVMADELAARGIAADVANDPGEGATAKVADQYDAIFYMFNNGPQASRCSIQPCRQALRDIDWTVINSDKPVIFVALRSPYLQYYLPGIPNLVCTYSNAASAQRALVKAILGEAPFAGKLPVKVPAHQ